MASMTAAAVAVPSFCGLRAEQAVVSSSSRVAMAPVGARPVAVRASSESVFSKVSKVAMAGVAATVLLAGSASADVTIKMGTDGGALRFIPDAVEVAVGEAINFVNNKGFPHNIVFDDDAVPDGIDTDDFNSEYLNAPGQTYTVSLPKAGSYSYYCQPHQGDGMKGTITVK